MRAACTAAVMRVQFNLCVDEPRVTCSGYTLDSFGAIRHEAQRIWKAQYKHITRPVNLRTAIRIHANLHVRQGVGMLDGACAFAPTHVLHSLAEMTAENRCRVYEYAYVTQTTGSIIYD